MGLPSWPPSLLALSLSLLTAAAEADKAEVEVGLTAGRVRGLLTEGARAFLGVPFGQSTAGEARFAPAKPLLRFPSDPFLAHTPAASCWGALDDNFGNWSGSAMWNPTNTMSEDCLQLNIWTPEDATAQSKYPVMVWIYGGGFFSGSPSLDLYRGDVLAGREKVVVVNINYRLGPFGFLFLGGDSGAPGNVGLRDQQLALTWIHQNIAKFGGDPERVCLFGESAGGASVTAHLVAEGSWPLFSSAIVMSGALTNPWAFVSQATARNRSQQLLRAAGCPAEDARGGLECLRALPAREVQSRLAFHPSIPTRTMEFPFVPVDADGVFFTGGINQALREGRFKDCPVVIGTVPDEGTFWLTYVLEQNVFPFDPLEQGDESSLVNRSQFLEAVNVTFEGYFSPALRGAIAHRYGSGAATSSDGAYYRDQLGQLYDNFFFTCDVLRFADFLAKDADRSSPTFRYRFLQRSPTNPWPKWMGVMHGYEIEYFFGAPFREKELYSETDRTVSALAMKAWAALASLGRPMEAGEWPAYAGPAPLTLEWRLPLRRSALSRPPACSFWAELRPCAESGAGPVTAGAPPGPWPLLALLFSALCSNTLLLAH